MLFEYDIRKSIGNEEKHGINFKEAQVLWDDEWRMEVALHYKGERRNALIASYGGVYWFAVFTTRRNVVRIISVRRATAKEVSLYERKKSER